MKYDYGLNIMLFARNEDIARERARVLKAASGYHDIVNSLGNSPEVRRDTFFSSIYTVYNVTHIVIFVNDIEESYDAISLLANIRRHKPKYYANALTVVIKKTGIPDYCIYNLGDYGKADMELSDDLQSAEILSELRASIGQPSETAVLGR